MISAKINNRSVRNSVVGGKDGSIVFAKERTKKRIGWPSTNRASHIKNYKRQKTQKYAASKNKIDNATVIRYSHNFSDSDSDSGNTKNALDALLPSTVILRNTNTCSNSNIKKQNYRHATPSKMVEKLTSCNTMEIDKIISDDISRPYAYINSVSKASSATVDDIKATKNIDFFEVIALDQPLPRLYNQEYVNVLKWNDKNSKSCMFDAKDISTTAWRHFGLSWHDYMNLVILVSPFRRDRLVLEKIKKLGPPRSINGIRRTFRVGDSRSRRIFFQIYYTPRISQKSRIDLPKSLVEATRGDEQSVVTELMKKSNCILKMDNIKRNKSGEGMIDVGAPFTSDSKQPIPTLYKHTNNNDDFGFKSINKNIDPINIFPDACFSDPSLLHPSICKNEVVGCPITVWYPMISTSDTAATLVRPEPR